MNKLLIFLFSLLAVSLEAATITNWGAQLPTAAPVGTDVILMQKGGVTYYFTPNQLAENIATNAAGGGITNSIRNLNGLGTNLNIKAIAGSSTALTVDTNALVVVGGNVTIGTNFSLSKLHVRPMYSGQNYLRVDDTNGTARIQAGVYPSGANLGGLWFGDATPNNDNFGFIGDTLSTYINGPSSTAPLYLSQAGMARFFLMSGGHLGCFVDNTYDIGAVGATRPRNVFIAGSNTVNTVTIQGTTNQVTFGATNIAPASAVAPTKWVSVRVSGDAGVYRLPLYE